MSLRRSAQLSVALAATGAISMTMLAPAQAAGNGAPNGPHYNLNIIGVSKDKTADMTGNNGHRIFVPLDGKTKIGLAEAPVGEDFAVLDANGTDRDGARFQLPNPDPDGDGTTAYSVYARALGTPGGAARVQTCAEDVLTGEEVCSLEVLTVSRDRGKTTFENVSDELLSIVVDITDDGVDNPVRYPLFSEELKNYFWSYDNTGLKVLQLRFYEQTHTFTAVS